MSRVPYPFRMAVCSVRRCTAETAHVVPAASPEFGRFEAAVCNEHNGPSMPAPSGATHRR